MSLIPSSETKFQPQFQWKWRSSPINSVEIVRCKIEAWKIVFILFTTTTSRKYTCLHLSRILGFTRRKWFAQADFLCGKLWGRKCYSKTTILGCSSTVRAPVFQTGDEGSIPFTRSINLMMFQIIFDQWDFLSDLNRYKMVVCNIWVQDTRGQISYAIVCVKDKQTFPKFLWIVDFDCVVQILKNHYSTVPGFCCKIIKINVKCCSLIFSVLEKQ